MLKKAAHALEIAKSLAILTIARLLLYVLILYVLTVCRSRSAGVEFDHVLDVDLHRDFLGFRLASQGGLQGRQVDVQIARNRRQHIAVSAFGRNLERNHGLALGLDLNGLARLDAIGRAVDDVAVNEDVAVNHELTCLSGGAAFSMIRILCAGLALLIGALLAIVPWIMALIRDLGTERASKEREEERADMTAHLHDGVLQTLALIQLHADDQQTVFSLARSQERELREWLYQERTTSDRSVNAGLKEIAAHVEDTHGKPIEVVTVGDARPSAQTDALLDATQQALINAVAHGGEPISVYCEASSKLVEVFVRDHGNGFDVNAIPANRLGIRESIIGRIKRRGGTVEIVSRPQWGTEVRMHMPIADMPATAAADTNAQQSHEPQSNSQQTDFPNHHNRQSNNQRTNQFSNQPTNHFEEQQ